MSNKTVTLTFNNQSHTLTADDNGRFNLNELHRISGTTATKRPGNWLRSAQAIDLANKFSSAQIRAVERREGGNGGGTWSVVEMVYAYAMWISSDFYKAVIDCFTAAVEGDGDKAVKIAQSAARLDGVEYRKKFSSAVCEATYGGGREAYRLATNKVYVGLFNKDTASLREDLGLSGRKTPRDKMGDDALDAIKAVEALSAIAMRNNHTNGEVRWERVLDRVLDNIKQSLGLGHTVFLDPTK